MYSAFSLVRLVHRAVSFPGEYTFSCVLQLDITSCPFDCVRSKWFYNLYCRCSMSFLFSILVILLVFPFFCKWYLTKYLPAWSELLDILRSAGKN